MALALAMGRKPMQPHGTARGEHHEHPAQAECFRRSGGVPEGLNWCPDDAHLKGGSLGARNDAGHGGGRGRDQAGRGARARARP